MSLAIALVEPEIPANTGNISRTCVAIGATLHICGTPAFSLDDKMVKRAGLDYWHELDLQLWDNLESLLAVYRGGVYYATTKAEQIYSDIVYPENTLLVFGKETKGLPESLLQVHPERCIRIPMLEKYRSLNLSNSVAVIAYEYMRQQAFPELLQASQHFL